MTSVGSTEAGVRSEWASFEDWYAAAWPGLVAAMVALVGDRERGIDLAAEAAARAFTHWSTIQHPTAWAHGVGVNLARRQWHRRGTERSLLQRLHRDPAQVLDDHVDPELWAEVARLPARQRTAVILRYVGDLAQKEVAEAMGIEPGTAAATLNAARSTLRRRLGDPTNLEEQ